MSILDPPILTRTSYEDAFWENDHLDHTLSRREIPGSPGCIQKCVDCGRWGNVNDGLFTPAGWVEHGSCVVCFKNERVRQKEAEREQAGRKTNRTAMWEAHFDESVNAEVALLQLGLLVDHDKFLPHNVAERVISGESNAGRRKWMKDLKERIHESGTLPTLQDPNIRLPRREVPRAVDEEADRQPPGLMRQPAPTESTGVRERYVSVDEDEHALGTPHDTMHHAQLNPVRMFEPYPFVFAVDEVHVTHSEEVRRACEVCLVRADGGLI